MAAKVVIGANFGDEGKGLFTDYLVSKSKKPIVVRFNGGPQAGHTVQTPDNKRHVFHHIGSGALQGAPTFLSQFFLVNPIMFLQEAEAFSAFQVHNQIYVDQRALVTLPCDVWINWAIEHSRGNNRHGSCGMGINETVERNTATTQHKPYQLTVSDIVHLSDNQLFDLIKQIHTEYIPLRLKKLTQQMPSFEFTYADKINDQEIKDFIQTCRLFLTFVTVESTCNFLKNFSDIIFEGAQGLLLDQHHKFFPHVTRSNTGIDNVGAILKQINVTAAEVFYITRTYLTRHGAGPLPYECSKQDVSDLIEDVTNIPNDFQHTLRFAPINLDLLKTTITADINKFPVVIIPNLVITCADHFPASGSLIPFVSDNKKGLAVDRNALITSMVKTNKAFQHVYVSTGPTRDDIQHINPQKGLKL